jgi:superfamily I DNA and/or RNA helicase
MKLTERLSQLSEALRLEKQEELNSFVPGFGEVNVSEKIANGKTLFPVNFQDIEFTSFGDSHFKFLINDNQSASFFRASSSVTVFNLDKQSAKGIVIRVKNNEIYVKLNQEDIAEWVKGGNLGIDLLPDAKTYDLYLDGLKSIEDTDFPASIKCIYNGGNSLTQKVENAFLDLNDSQAQAGSQILAEDDKAVIIHGPPGTGKTTTLISVISQLLKNNKRILVVAPTNAAVDNFGSKLLSSSIDFCRIGNPIKVDSKLEAMTLDSKSKNDSSFKLVERLKKDLSALRKKTFKYKRSFTKKDRDERNQSKKELKYLRADIKKIQKDIYKTVLRDTNVICGTFAGVLSERGVTGDFDYVFVDEAAQSIEPAVWVISALANRLVLAGDNFQLPPFVKSSKALKLGLDKTIFDAAVNSNFKFNLLNLQYRMNDKIMGFSNSYFYANKLSSSNVVKDWVLKDEVYDAIEFIDTAGCDYNEGQVEDSVGLQNVGEVGIVLNRITDIDLESNSVSIISPYRSQVSLLRERLPSLKNQIDTIDSFQGQERDVIVLSLVRSNQKNEIGFLKDYRRINVAMTRAKKKLVIIGDSSTIGTDNFFVKMLDFIESNGSYRSAWEFM